MDNGEAFTASRYNVPNSERCKAMSMRRDKERCPFRQVADGLCRRHLRFGAVIPDEWTRDNIPVFYIPKANG